MSPADALRQGLGDSRPDSDRRAWSQGSGDPAVGRPKRPGPQL